MRTTVRLDDDVAAAVRRLREEGSLGLNEAVNALIRRGLATRPADTGPYEHRARDMGMLVDVTDVEAALDLAEGPLRR